MAWVGGLHFKVGNVGLVGSLTFPDEFWTKLIKNLVGMDVWPTTATGRRRMRIGALALACVAAGMFSALSISPAFAQKTTFTQKDDPPMPKWMQLCGPDFISFVGRRWLPSSNAYNKSNDLDAVNFWTVQRRSILSVRAFQYGDDLRAFVAVDLGNHRLSKDGNPIDIVISGDGYRLLRTCLARETRP